MDIFTMYENNMFCYQKYGEHHTRSETPLKSEKNRK